MIGLEDIVEVPITDEEFNYAKNNPFKGYKNEITGQLKTLGSMALMKILNVSHGDFVQQLEAASYLQSTYVCETVDGKPVGINPAIMTIRDGNVLSKQIIVPTNQLFKNNQLDNHYTVAVFVVNAKDEQGGFQKPSKVLIAGWQESRKIFENSKRQDNKFNKNKKSLTECSTDINLLPIQYLLSKVSYHKIRV